MRNIDNILNIIELKKKHGEFTIEKVGQAIGFKKAGFNKLIDEGRDLDNEKVEKFVALYSTIITDAGYEVVDNYDVFGKTGKAIVKKGEANKYIEIKGGLDESGADGGVSSGQPDLASDPRSRLLKAFHTLSEAQELLKGYLDETANKTESDAFEEKDTKEVLDDASSRKDKKTGTGNSGKGQSKP